MKANVHVYTLAGGPPIAALHVRYNHHPTQGLPFWRDLAADSELDTGNTHAVERSLFSHTNHRTARPPIRGPCRVCRPPAACETSSPRDTREGRQPSRLDALGNAAAFSWGLCISQDLQCCCTAAQSSRCSAVLPRVDSAHVSLFAARIAAADDLDPISGHPGHLLREHRLTVTETHHKMSYGCMADMTSGLLEGLQLPAGKVVSSGIRRWLQAHSLLSLWEGKIADNVADTAPSTIARCCRR